MYSARSSTDSGTPDERDPRWSAHAVGDCLLEAVAMADAAEVRQQEIGHRVVAALERRGEPEPFLVLGEQRAPQNPAAEAVTLVGDQQPARLARRHGLVRGGGVARRDEHVARRRRRPSRCRPAARSGRRAAPFVSRPCHCSMSTRDGTTTSTNRPRRNASAAAAIATSVLPEPVTASTTPRRPQLSQLDERVELPGVQRALLEVGPGGHHSATTLYRHGTNTLPPPRRGSVHRLDAAARVVSESANERADPHGQCPRDRLRRRGHAGRDRSASSGRRGRRGRASVPASTRTPCSRRAASTPRSARAIPRTRGSSTSPTRSRRATCSVILASSRSWCGRRRPRSRSWPSGDAAFARTDDGRIDQRFFGAHRWRRTCYAGDYSGRALLHTLADKVAALGIPVVDEHYVSQLLIADGACFGAIAFDLHDGSRTAFVADAVVLCGGGHTRIWRRSSSRRDENFGEAMALALRAGCRVKDMELVQFHPTGMVAPEEAAGMLVTEAVRGEGGHLYNADGERFMARYDAGADGAEHPRPGRARELHRDRRGTRRTERRRLPRHHARGQGRDHHEAAAHVPPVHRVPDARHLP